MDGKGILQILIAVVIMAIASFSGQFFFGLILAVPVMLWGTELRVIQIAIVALLAALAVLAFVFRTWWSKT